jgi:phage-related protein
MAVTVDELLIKISLSNDKTAAELSAIKGELNSLKKATDNVAESNKGFFKSFTEVNLGIFAFVQNIQFAINKVEEFIKPFMDSADAATRFGFAMNQVGVKDTKAMADGIEKLGEQMQILGIAEDDQITQLAAVAIASGRSAKQIEVMVKSAAGISTIKPETSFIEAFNALAMSFKGNGRALLLLAPELKKMSEEAFRAGEGAEYMLQKFGSYAQKNLELFSGKTKASRLALGEFVEQLGGFVSKAIGLPGIIDKSTAAFNSLASSVKKANEAFDGFDFSSLIASLAAVAAAFAIAPIANYALQLAALIKLFGGLSAVASATLIPLLSYAGVAAGFMTLAASVNIVYLNFSSLVTMIKEGLTVALDGLILGINRTIAAGISLIDDFITPLANIIPGLKQFTDTNKKTLSDLDKEYDRTSKNIDKNLGVIYDGLVNLDTGFAGQGVTVFNKLLGDTKEALDGVAASSNAAGYSLGGMVSEDATKALDELKSKFEELRKAAGTQGLEGAALVNAQRDADLNSIKAIEERLRIGNGLTAQAKEQLKISKNLINIGSDLKNKELEKKSLEDLQKETASLNDSVNKEQMNTLDYIQENLKGQQDILDAKYEQLKVQGLLTPKAEAEIGKQRGLIEKKAEIDSSKAPGREYEDAKKAGESVIDGITQSFQSGATGLIAGGLAVAEKAVQAIHSLIDFLPNLISGIANIFTKLTDFPKVLTSAFANLFKSIGAFIREFVSNLVNMIGDLPDMLANFINDLPVAFAEGAMKFVESIGKLAERLPEIIESLVSGIIAYMPEIVISLVEVLIKEGPRIGMAILKAIYIDIPIAIVKGIVEGVKRVAKAIGNLLSGKGFKVETKIDTKPLEASMKKLSEQSSRIFSVSDMTKAAEDPLKKLADGVGSAFDKGKNSVMQAWQWVLDKIWKPIEEGLKAVWMFVFNAFSLTWEAVKQIFAAIVEGFSLAWEVVKQIFNGIIQGFSSSWEVIKQIFAVITNTISALWEGLKQSVSIAFSYVKNLWDGLTNTVSIAFKFVKDLWDALVNIVESAFKSPKALFDSLKAVVELAFKFVKDMWDNLSGTVSKAFGFVKDIVDNFSNVGTKIVDGLKNGLSSVGNIFSDFGTSIWTSLKKSLSGVGQFFVDAFNSLNPLNLFEKIFKVPPSGTGTVEKALGINIPFMKFAQGGIVPGNATVKGDSFKNDKIVAMLSPGEAIIPRSLMDKPEIRALVQQIMEGKINPPQFAFGGSIGAAIGSAAGSVGGAIANAGGVIIDQATGIAQGAGNFLEDVFNNLNPLKTMWETVKSKVFDDLIMNMLKRNKFADGGLVGMGTDTVPAMLTPGEFVVSRQGVNAAGLGMLRSINNGMAPSGQNTYNISFSINVEAKTQMDEGYIKATLIPRMTDELKRASLDGKFVISSKGVR